MGSGTFSSPPTALTSSVRRSGFISSGGFFFLASFGGGSGEGEGDGELTAFFSRRRFSSFRALPSDLPSDLDLGPSEPGRGESFARASESVCPKSASNFPPPFSSFTFPPAPTPDFVFIDVDATACKHHYSLSDSHFKLP